ncbi:MAG TPA: ROK family protein [Chloroflexi bacterium]|nr:ROK family protein [Chloroflexota bacterium]
MDILGIDIGGSGIKGAPVNVKKGTLTAQRFRIATPQPSTPEAVGDVVADVAAHFAWTGPIGCTFPAVVKDGVTYTAANVDQAWIGFDGRKLLERKTECPVTLINDADAAGIAEVRFGAGRTHRKRGVIFVLTFGTGIGSAIFVQGVLLPNSELGHIEMNGIEAEEYASDRIRQEQRLSWKEWAARVNEYLHLLAALFTPDLFIVGGGASKKTKFLRHLGAQADIVPAQMRNEAGIVGAALVAQTAIKESRNDGSKPLEIT